MQGRRGESSGGQSTRLPTIAPRYEDGASEGARALNPVTSELRRNRLPPRSRSGCWTCRTRKVKCDEQRPSCGQCTRLGHTCDYNPRLAFRDDTQRILERMQDVNTAGNTIWDPDANSDSRPAEIKDTLPPFSTLTTDEERERKAEARGPGQYFVLANPESFASLPEYRNESLADLDRVISFDSAHYDTESSSQVLNSGDPDVVILKTFEDPLRRTQVPNQPHISSHRSSHFVAPSNPQVPGIQLSMLDIARNGGRDAELLQHYRTVISPKIVRTERVVGGEDLVEAQARTYPPLYHAMMALSALSIAHNVQSADALEHYQQVIPALKSTVQSTEESYSDGAFLSHYILLLYEVAAVGNRESNMWQHHSNALLRIITLRRQTRIMEHHNWIIFSIYLMDIYALLSGTGSGSFVDILLQQNMIPEPDQIFPPIRPGHPQIFYPEEAPYFPALIQLNQEMLLLALQIGKMAQDLRAEATKRVFQGENQDVPDVVYEMNRRTSIQALHLVINNSRTDWRARYPAYCSWSSRPDTVPLRVFRAVEHSYMLFRACIIYAHTSMYPGQLRDPAPDFDIQINTCAKDIIKAASVGLAQERFELRYLVFPLFMAGIFTKDHNEKETAPNLITTVEPHSLGRSMESVKILLQTIYDKQRAAIMHFGDANSVDWVEEMEMSGQRLIIMGL